MKTLLFLEEVKKSKPDVPKMSVLLILSILIYIKALPSIDRPKLNDNFGIVSLTISVGKKNHN